MKKTLLAAALMAGFAGVAQAETSVTLYGIVDTGLGYTQFKDKFGDDVKSSRTGFYDGVQSGNRWGLRGSEDLGDGLRAIFTLESGFTLTDGKSAQGGRQFGREATLGLAGDSWGSLVFGRQTNVASRFVGDIASPFGDAFALAAIGQTFTSAATVRADNTVVYATPNFNGFDFAVGYSFNADGSQKWDVKNNGSNPKDGNAKLVTTGLRYANGPVAVAVSYDNLKASSWDKSAQAWSLAGSYDFEVVKLHLAWGQERNGIIGERRGVSGVDGFGTLERTVAGDTKNAGWKDYKVNNFAVGVSAPVGAAGKVMAGWAMSRASDNDWYSARNVSGEGKKSQNLFSVGYTYNLSKRTNVYAVGTYGTGYMFQDTRATQAIVGLRHRF